MSPLLNRRTLLIQSLAALGMSTLPAAAALRPYKLSARNATIEFDFSLNGIRQKGTAPLNSADLRIDPDNLAASRADVFADISRAKTGLVFATDALKSTEVLDTKNHPTARFRSTKVTLGAGGRISDGATLDGQLTLRGVTRPIRFSASLFRPSGTAGNQLDTLEVRLRGSIDRTAFGAVGYPKLVASKVGLNIRAEITATG